MYICFIIYHFVALALLYAVSEEFFNLEVLVPCYSFHLWLTLSNIPFSVVV